MPVDEQILVAGTSAVPLSYTVPNSIEAALLCVNATIDGTAASGSFLAVVEIISDGGVVVARCPCFTTLAAGGSAEISWFRLRDQTATVTSTTTPYENLIFSTGGLQLYWKLDEAVGTGTIVDSYDGNTGTVFGTVAQGQPKLADGLSAQFTAGMVGRKTVVNVDQTSQLMSALVWVKSTAAAANNWLAWSDTSAPNGRWFAMNLEGGGNIGVTVYDNGATGHTFGGSVVVNDGAKHCVAFTYGATDPLTGLGAVGSIYVDGVLDTATPLAMGGVGLAKTNTSMILGAKWRNAFDDPAGIEQLVGTLDEFAIFNTTLTAAQLAAINTAGRV